MIYLRILNLANAFVRSWKIYLKEIQTKAGEAIFHSENVISIRNICLHGQVYLHNLRHLEITS